MIKHALILLVDDEPAIREMYQRRLIQEGYKVITASNGREGIEMTKQHKPDMVLMDVKMPEMDGIEAATKLKEDSELKNIKIVFLTAFSDPARPEIDRKIAKGIGAEDFIEKSLRLNEFVERVNQIVKPLK